MEQKPGKQLMPPPEMFVTVEDLYKFDLNLFKTQVDLEIVRTNHLEARHELLASDDRRSSID